tara:strand:- start:801 stop:992 length:192 start_codon:yes stop_codon:yes gene_type:complete
MKHSEIRAAERERIARIFDSQAANAQSWADGHAAEQTTEVYRETCAAEAIRLRMVARTIRASG